MARPPAPAPTPRRAAWAGRPPADAAEAKGRLVDATIACVSRLGWERTSMTAIATEAGVSRPTLYAHFPHREAVLEAAMAEAANRLVERVWAVGERAETGGEFVVEAMMVALAEFPVDPVLSLIASPGADTAAWARDSLSPASVSVGRRFLAPLERLAPEVADDMDEITETAIRFLLSLLLFPDPVPRAPDDQRAYLRRRLVPALGLT